MSSDVTFLVEKATSPLLLDNDWETTMYIVDLIRQGDIVPKSAINTILVRLSDSNPNIVLLALQLLESVVKNCGQIIHEYIATRDFMEDITEILRKSPNDEVRKRILAMLGAWVYAFRNEPKYRAVQDTVNILKVTGQQIPSVIESDAMFTADRAPDWADGECCHRCRSQFTLLRRKHHCRACGQVFCSDCSSKASTIPKFGIEREVRVCESCHDDINSMATARPQDATKKSTDSTVLGETTPKAPKSAASTKSQELREEEELQLAIALSKSEAETKEKEKIRATYNLLGGGPKNTLPTSHGPTYHAPPSEVEADPELAKYLNRSFWEEQKAKTRDLPSKNLGGDTNTSHSPSYSPSLPSAPFSGARVTSPKMKEILVGNSDGDSGGDSVDMFVSNLNSQLEIFCNRMESNRSRGRPIANDSAVQSLFMNLTTMHSQLLQLIQEQDRKRMHFEYLQDKITQIRDARAALEALREDHRERIRKEREDQEKIRQMQMLQKLEIMRKKKQEYLEYQRQLALHRMAESERQIMSGVPPQPQAGPPPNYPNFHNNSGAFHMPQHPPQMGGYMYHPPQTTEAGPPPYQAPIGQQPGSHNGVHYPPPGPGAAMMGQHMPNTFGVQGMPPQHGQMQQPAYPGHHPSTSPQGVPPNPIGGPPIGAPPPPPGAPPPIPGMEQQGPPQHPAPIEAASHAPPPVMEKEAELITFD